MYRFSGNYLSRSPHSDRTRSVGLALVAALSDLLTTEANRPPAVATTSTRSLSHLGRMTPSTRTIRVLPHDVHLIIASFADRKSLLALLATSRGLHSDCGKFILQDTVVLRDDLDIHSFLDFMHPHKGKRWRHLHSLYLREAPITPVVAEELATVIPRASHLQSLEFENAEGTLGAHPDLPLAFAAIPSIKHITIEHGYQHTCAMLEAMHWPLETAVLRTTAYTSHWPDADAGGRMHPAAILKNSRATLKILKCDAWSDCSATLQTYPVYPKLEYLTVTGIWCPRTAQWAITYPTLKRLTMYTIESHTTMDDEELADQELTRSVNVNEYMAQGQQWRDLERFHGGTLDLYLLGFTCRIQDVSLTLSADELQFFSPTMATARPTHLSLSITTRLFSQLVPTYLHDPGLADLKSFELNATVWIGGTDRYEGGTDVDGYLVKLQFPRHPATADTLPAGTCIRSPTTCFRPAIHVFPDGPKLPLPHTPFHFPHRVTGTS